MAHFAQVDENNKVVQVVVVADELEHRGEDYLANELGLGGRWIQTSYNHKIRNRFAGVGMNYDEDADVFYPKQPFSKWILNKKTWLWEAPIPAPSDQHRWDDEAGEWVLDELETK